VADVNADGRLDLITANAGSADVSILLGNGDGTFQAQSRIPVGPGPADVAVADLDDDGFLDLVTANSLAADVSILSILLGNGDGTFGQPGRFAAGVSPAAATAN
jgi:hypothetical protein